MVVMLALAGRFEQLPCIFIDVRDIRTVVLRLLDIDLRKPVTWLSFSFVSSFR
jgi:hypothetical protein